MSFEVMDEAGLKEKSKKLKQAYQEATKEYAALSGEEKKQAKKRETPSVKKIKGLTDAGEAAKLALELAEKHEKDKDKGDKKE